MKNITVKIHNSDNNILDEIVVVTKDGKPTIIERFDEVNYEFINAINGRAPDHIVTTRIDKDLHVSFEEEGKTSDLIIEGFFDAEDQALIGLAEDNNFYYYIPDTGEVADYVTQLEDGDVEGQALGGYKLEFAGWLPFPPGELGLPWFAGLGLLPAAFAFAGGGGDDDSTSIPQSPEASTIDTFDDSATGIPGEAITQNVLGNDRNADPNTLLLIDPSNPGTPVDTVVVPGEGTWTVGPNPGEVTFTPEPGFSGDPTPIQYVVDDPQGNPSEPTEVSVDYLPTTLPDIKQGVVGQPVTQNVIDNDSQADPDTVLLIDPANPDTPVDTVVIPGEGTWTVGPNPGEVTFTPEPGFSGDPTPIQYVVDDPQGNTSEPTNVSVDYPPTTLPDSELGLNGQPVTQSILDNDEQADPDTVLLIDPANPDTPVDTVVIPGEGTWTVGPNLGEVTFTPEPGFSGDPTPIQYVVDDPQGNTSEPTNVSVDYPPTTLPNSVIAPAGTTVTQNVIDNDKHVDPDTVLLIDPANPDTPVDTVVIPGEGTWTVGPNPGEVTFTPEPGFSGDPTPIQYVVDDPQGNTSEPTEVDVIPELAVASLIVSEEALKGGIQDNTGINGDHSSSAVQTGLITVGDLNITGGNGTLTISLTGPTGITALGEQVTWSQTGNVLTGTANIGGNAVDIMTLTVDNFTQASNGLYTANYTTKLLYAIDHPDTSGEDSLDLSFSATVSNGATTTNAANFTVTVEDDMPSLKTGIVDTAVPPVDVNLMLIMDTSGSMNRKDNGNPKNRLELMQEALTAAILEYDKFGEVKVRLIRFDRTGGTLGTVWLSAEKAIEFIQDLSNYPLGDRTRYDVALNAAMDAFDAEGKTKSLATTNSQGQPISNEPLNKIIFVSDGQPYPSGSAIDSTLEDQWTDFLTGNDSTHNADGLKIEADAYNIIYPTGNTTYIDPIAYDGVNDVDTNGVAVTPTGLKDEILNGIEVSVDNGSLVNTSNVLETGFGADDGYLVEFTLDGFTYEYDRNTDTFTADPNSTASYSFDPNTHILEVITEKGGTFSIDFDDASYNYQASKIILETYEENITYITRDNDGDTADNDITLNIYRFEAVSDIILTNQTGSSIELDYALLLQNDQVNGNQLVRDDLFDHLSNGTLANSPSAVTFTFDAGASTGAFNYAIEQDGQLDNATVTLSQITGDTITGTVNNETLIGADGQDNTLNGEDGDDILIGGDGADTLNGGAGADILYYDETDTLIDGGSSTQPDGSKDLDILHIDSLSGSLVVTNIDNIEILDLGNSQADTLTLTLQDLIDMTDTDNTLFIDGDGASDTVDIDLSDFSQAATSDVEGYQLYNANAGEKLYIETDIIVI